MHNRRLIDNGRQKSDLLRQAKHYRINLSKALDQCLTQRVLEEKRHAWLEENREAIDEYNAYVRKHGPFGDRHRRF